MRMLMFEWGLSIFGQGLVVFFDEETAPWVSGESLVETRVVGGGAAASGNRGRLPLTVGRRYGWNPMAGHRVVNR